MSIIESVNPANGEVVGSVEITPSEHVPEIVARARRAQRDWGTTTLEARVEILRRAGELLTERAADIGRTATLEMGKPLREAVGEAQFVASSFSKELDRMAAALAPELIESERVTSTIFQDPFGVVACISPWNFPVLMPHQQLLPALVAGNAVVFKPSEEAPLTGQAYADALLAVLPEGVLTVIHGADEQGKALVAADVDLIVFTGSRGAGKHIIQQAGKDLKRVILELGGKDPMIVLDDADVAGAAAFAARNSFRNCGQVCISTERIYVDRSIRDRFLEELESVAATMTVGDGSEEGTRVGPMVNGVQRSHVARQIDAAVAQGAKVAWRGEAPEGDCFIAPAILTGLTPEMEIAREETFGPVACVYDVDGEDEAVELANDTPFALGAVVFGEPERARRVARRLTAGMIGVNQGLSSAGDTPWVGARQSGYGFHSGRDGHRQFAQTRVVSEPRG